MKKIILIFIIFSTFFLIGCEKNIQKQNIVQNKNIECNSNMKIWKNKTYNFSVCIPNNWGAIDLYSGNVSSNLKISDNSEIIGDGIYHEISLQGIIENTLGKYDIKSTFGNKKIIEHYIINNDGKKELNIYYFILKTGKNKYSSFGFNEKTDEMKAIINSIKVLK